MIRNTFSGIARPSFPTLASLRQRGAELLDLPPQPQAQPPEPDTDPPPRRDRAPQPSFAPAPRRKCMSQKTHDPYSCISGVLPKNAATLAYGPLVLVL